MLSSRDTRTSLQNKLIQPKHPYPCTAEGNILYVLLFSFVKDLSNQWKIELHRLQNRCISTSHWLRRNKLTFMNILRELLVSLLRLAESQFPFRSWKWGGPVKFFSSSILLYCLQYCWMWTCFSILISCGQFVVFLMISKHVIINLCIPDIFIREAHSWEEEWSSGHREFPPLNDPNNITEDQKQKEKNWTARNKRTWSQLYRDFSKWAIWLYSIPGH